MKKRLLVLFVTMFIFQSAIAEDINVRALSTVTRDAPVLLTESVAFSTSGDNNYITFHVSDIAHGEAANAAIKEHSGYFAYNPPSDGYEYYIVTLDVVATSTESQRLTFEYDDFEAVSSSGVVIEMSQSSQLMSDLTLYTDGSGTITLTFRAKIDSAQYLLYKQEIWMSLVEDI